MTRDKSSEEFIGIKKLCNYRADQKKTGEERILVQKRNDQTSKGMVLWEEEVQTKVKEIKWSGGKYEGYF